jgi:protein SCO1/2
VNTHIRLIPLALILAGTFLISSCHRTNTPATKRYPFTGRIISMDYQTSTALIAGDNIPGFMDAMTMSYKIKQPGLASKIALSPGDSISAEAVVESDSNNEGSVGDYWLENVKVTAHASSPPAAAAGTLHIPAPGESVPDFSFTNQSGQKHSLNQYRGQVLLLTFIYTRCPFPDFCPRISSNFAEIYKQIETNPSLGGLHLLSISFDPGHDTPKVLRDYAFSVAHSHDPALFTRWEFAAPKSADLPKLADFFALTVKPEGGLITHNLSTVVISPDGKIVKWYHGSDWQVSDLMKDASAATKP